MCSYLDQVGATYYFRRAVPLDLVGCFATATGKPRTEWKFSLRTKDREAAKRLLRPYEVDTDKLIDDARAALKPPLVLSPAEVAAQQRAAEEQAAQAALEAESMARREARSELRTQWRQRRRMSTAMLDPEEAAAVDLIKEKDAELEELRAAVATLRAGAEELGGGVRGQPSSAALYPQPGTTLSLSGLYERYAASGAANPKTVVKWRSRVAALIHFLGHDDACRVSRADLNRWVEGLVAKGLAKKTIEAGYLPAIKVTLSLAVDDEAIPSNPATALRVRAPKPAKLRERDLTDDEATTILASALGPQPAGLAPSHALARRWVPWLCAYTGARVGEICQLRAKDIRQEQGVWVIHITPVAGAVKTHEARSVPLHPHLIEQGLEKLAKAEDTSPLFYQEGAGNEVNPGAKIRAAHLARWVRSLGVDAPQPFHGWRHRFKTVARTVGVEEYVAERIQGHAPRHAGGGYGFVTLATMRDAIARLPRYVVGEAGVASEGR